MDPPDGAKTFDRRTLLKAASGLSFVFIGGAYYLDLSGRTLLTSSNPDFRRVWERTDKPVADGVVSRTWIWGPTSNTEPMNEPYVESPGGVRLVQYFDKARMEINNPAADPSSIWFVTNGLLTVELISGDMQTGNNSFEDRSPAQVNVAGDADDPNGPQYASFTSLLSAPGQAAGTTLVQKVNRAGTVTSDQSLASQGIVVGMVDEVTGHGIAAPFWSFMNSSGTVYANGQFFQDELFQNAFFATGRPITEAYWADVVVGGTSKLVLMQCFERRCLTYTPDNDPNWRVEMGNIGLHYYTWRYGQAVPPTATATATVDASPTATVTPTVTPEPTATHAPGEGPLSALGKITLLRVHDPGTAYGPSGDVIDGEVVIKLDSQGDRAFGFQLRVNSGEAAHRGMLNLLRDAFRHDRSVLIDYYTTGPQNGRLFRVICDN
jgi:hypothetical protein